MNIQSIKNSQVFLGIKRRANGLMEKVVSWTQIEDSDSIKKAGNFQLLYSASVCVCVWERDDTQQRQ